MPLTRLRNQSASIITSGTFADARIAASNVSQHAVSFDDNKIVNDLSTLGLRVHTQENLSASNTNSQYVDVFQDSTGITNLSNASRADDEFVATTYTTTGAFSNDSNTVFLLHFNNNVTDSGSNSMSMTATGSPTYSTSVKKFGTHSISLDGSDDYIKSPEIQTNDSTVGFGADGTTDYTFEGWFKHDLTSWSSTPRYWAIGNNGTAPENGNTPMISVGRPSANTSEINYWGYQGSVNHNFTVGAVDTDWHHYCTVRSSGTTYFYLDGVQKDSTTNMDDSIFYGNGTVFIGARTAASGEYFNGYVDEVRFSNNARYSFGSNGTSYFTPNETTVSNATGSFESNAISLADSSSISSAGAVITYQDNAGTNALNTDIVLQISADNGSNYTTATLTALPDFSSGIKCAKVNDLSIGTPGSQLKYKISFANQSTGVKEARIRGVSLNY